MVDSVELSFQLLDLEEAVTDLGFESVYFAVLLPELLVFGGRDLLQLRKASSRLASRFRSCS